MGQKTPSSRVLVSRKAGRPRGLALKIILLIFLFCGRHIGRPFNTLRAWLHYWGSIKICGIKEKLI